MSNVIPLLIIFAVAYWLLSRKKDTLMACTTCESISPSRKKTGGSLAIEIILWLCFLVPGIIYSLWRMSSKNRVCGTCGASTIVPLSTPAGQKIAAKIKQS